jgi:hypothetical protein
VTRLKWNLDSVRLEIVLILTQDRCTVCVELSRGSKSLCMHRMKLLDDVGHLESYFGLFGDSFSVSTT